MGYCCDSAKEFLTSARWQQAFFESYETALYYRSESPGSGKWITELGQEILAKYQEYYLVNSAEHLFNQAAGSDLTSTDTSSLSANVLVLNVGNYFELPVPLYAAFVFGKDLIPLFFKQRLDQPEMDYVLSQLKRAGITSELPEYHPVI